MGLKSLETCLFRIFDEDEDGQIHAADLVEVLTSFGDKLTKSEARKLVQKAHKSDGGLIDYQGDVCSWPIMVGVKSGMLLTALCVAALAVGKICCSRKNLAGISTSGDASNKPRWTLLEST